MTNPTDESSHTGPLVGSVRGLAMAALALAVVNYLLGFVDGVYQLAFGLPGALLVGGGLLCGAALLPRLSGLLAPATVIAVVGVLQALLWAAAGPQVIGPVLIIVLLLGVFEAVAAACALLIRHGVIDGPSSDRAGWRTRSAMGNAFGQPAPGQFGSGAQGGPSAPGPGGAAPGGQYAASPYPVAPYPGSPYGGSWYQGAQYQQGGQYAPGHQGGQYAGTPYGGSAPGGWSGPGYGQSPAGYGGYPQPAPGYPAYPQVPGYPPPDQAAYRPAEQAPGGQGQSGDHAERAGVSAAGSAAPAPGTGSTADAALANQPTQQTAAHSPSGPPDAASAWAQQPESADRPEPSPQGGQATDAGRGGANQTRHLSAPTDADHGARSDGAD
jgi:hypothetical protein